MHYECDRDLLAELPRVARRALHTDLLGRFDLGFLVRVLAGDDEVVEEVVADQAFNPMRSGFSSAEFPLMGTLDPYGDTSFTFYQCGQLEAEVRQAAGHLAELGVSDTFIASLIDLCAAARAQSRRRLVFYGD
jgi:hypothetical protein